VWREKGEGSAARLAPTWRRAASTQRNARVAMPIARRSRPRGGLSRPVWTGRISFGLVSIPVGLYGAVLSSERISFHLLHGKDMAPIRYKKFCRVEDVEVANDEIVKARRSGKNGWKVLRPDEIDQSAAEAAHDLRNTIEVLQFVSRRRSIPSRFDEPYLVAPRAGGEKAYGVLHAALRDRRRAGIVRLALRTRPHLAALVSGPRALVLQTLRPFEELQSASSLELPRAPTNRTEVKLAEVLIDRLSTDGWNPSRYPDAYRKALERLLASKNPRETTGPGRGTPDHVVDLMEALRRSVGTERRSAARRATSRRAGAA